MSETVTVENHGRSDLTLPCGTRIPAGGSAPVLVDRLREHVEQPVTRHWFEERILRADGPVLSRSSDFDCDCIATQGKLDEAEEKLRRATDRLEAERTARATADAEVARLTEALAAETKARTEADDLARLAADEVTKLQAAATEAEKAKAKGAGK